MFLGEWAITCPRCGSDELRGPWSDFRHDLHCWSLKTALLNVWFRLWYSRGR